MSKKAQKINVDLSDSDSDVEVPVIKKNAKKTDASKRKASAASDASSVKVTKAKKEEKKPKKQLQESSDEDEDIVKKPTKKSPKKAQKKVDSDDESSEVKPKKTSKKASKKQADSDDESEEEKPKAKNGKQNKKADSDDEDDEEIQVVKTQKKEEAEEDDGETHAELFIKNLPWSIDQDGLAEGFSEYGTVTNVKILTNKQTGKPSGLAFVAFENRSQAKKALANVTTIGDRQVSISFSNENRPSNDGPRQDRGPRQEGGFRPRQEFSGTAHTVFVGNLGFKTNENSISKFFSRAGNVVGIRIAKNEDGRAKGFCHVDFDTEEAADKATTFAGQSLDGREIRCDKAAARSRPSGGQGGFSRGGSGGFRGGKPGFSKPQHGRMGAGGNKKTFNDSDDE